MTGGKEEGGMEMGGREGKGRWDEKGGVEGEADGDGGR